MKLRSLLGGLTVGALLFTASAQPSYAALSQDQRIADFNELATIFERNYGPLRLKAQSIGLDWNANKANFLARSAAAGTDAEFYQVLTQFLASLHDAHVSAQVPSTYSSKLGFLCDYVNGKVLIDIINPLALPTALFPFQRGDQLISIDGVPVEQLMTQLALSDNTGNDTTTKRIAAARLTSRSEASGFAIPTGVSVLVILPRGATQPVTVTATWAVSGTAVAQLDDLSRLLGSAPIVNSVQSDAVASSDFDSYKMTLKNMPLFNTGMPKEKLADWMKAGIVDVGSTTSMFDLPAGAQVIDSVPMTAAIYESQGKKIGVLRIPEYEGDDMVSNLAQAIQILQPATDVLVLDQTNNPGGDVSMVSQIASIFADKSYKDMNFALRPSMEWSSQFDSINAQLAQMLQANPKDVEGNGLQARFAYLSQAIRDGMAKQQFLTAPVSLDLEGGYGYIQPQPVVRYTKPVLLLINGLDFSAGDAFPAVMQDNGRVTTFGENTNGAGGNVAPYGPLANSYFKFELTQSLMVRPNGNYIENKGVSADIKYDLNEDDFLNHYHSYVLNFTQAALKLVGVNATIDQINAEQAQIAAKIAADAAAQAAAAAAAAASPANPAPASGSAKIAQKQK